MHHDAAEEWFESGIRFATGPITQGSLVRLLSRDGQSADAAQTHIAAIAADERLEFFADEVAYSEVNIKASSAIAK